MKKMTAIVLAAMLMVICSIPAAFAAASGSFKLLTTNDDYEKMDATNVMIKLYFSEAVSSEASQKANESMFQFQDADGKDVPFQVIYNSKDSTNVNVLAKDDLETEKNYIVTVSGDMVSDSGEVLGKDQKIEFSTRKAASGGTYVLLMIAMMVVMVVMTLRDQKKKAAEEGVANQTLSISTNPYKLAKEKGISVAEATKLIQEERQKLAKKVEKAEKAAQKYAPKPEEKKEKPVQKTTFRMKTKRIVKKH